MKATLPRFNPLDVPISKAQMTGLGSSAAMVTAICAAFLIRMAPGLSVNDPPGKISMNTRAIIHNLAQHVHSLAEGKIGPGHKLSAASWGTHVYRRFAESCLEVPPGDVAAMSAVIKHSYNFLHHVMTGLCSQSLHRLDTCRALQKCWLNLCCPAEILTGFRKMKHPASNPSLFPH